MHRTELWRSFQQSVGSLSTGDRPGKIITEDVLGSSVVQLPKEEIAAITASLSCFCRETEEFASASGLRRALSRAVKVWFPDRRAIPLADLLAKVAAEIGNSNSEDNGFARLWSHLISNFGDASPVLRDRLETVFPLKRVTYDPYTIKISPRTGGEKIPPTGILSGTLQPIRTAYGTQWFLVGVGQGIGKTVKRWLHVDRARGDRLVEWIRKSLESYEGLDVSIQDDVLFNTDLGTNIIPSVLSMPSRIRYFTEGATNVGVSECAVVLDEVSDQVRLTKSYTGENIYTHYESVLSLASRPISTQLLVIFGRPIWSFDFGTVFKHLDSRWKGCPGNAEINRGVEFHPRIVLQPNIILRRACWKVPLQAFPKLSKSLSVSEVARVVSAWRLQFNLPDQVFVRYGSRGDGRGDGYKPQYINFRSIVWVLFLARILENVSETLVIDEALPEIRPEDSNKKRYTEEYAIHWRH